MQNFSEHEALISPRSEFFSRALNGSWKGADDRKVSLPDDEPDNCALYLKLLYERGNKLPTKDQYKVGKEYLILSKLYVLAEKLVDETTKQLVLSAIKCRAEDCSYILQEYCLPELDSVRVIYDGTPASSPARELLV
ncbi:hypothetical protein E8E12_007761 [Didymella heteroderae]|uniref:BTB domain-containing protein n=1 Tax=Didymella heteroderae TaxID=1769908 RepID=A0A9P5C6J9_9PLEO|nr:hypothetical protein E8E12_007761 [Didymella heteroderae]